MTYGPFPTRADAEYAAMNYYGTAITGASARDAFAIVALHGQTDPRVGPTPIELREVQPGACR